MAASRSELPQLSAVTSAAVLPVLALREMKLTAHRRAVLAVLEHSDRPLTADEVVHRSGVPQSTAYRNLAELIDAGVVSRVAGAGGADRHELAEPLSHHHHHAVCIECGIVTDFEPSQRLERLIEQEIGTFLAATGFAVDHHVFDVRGRCASCASGRR